MRWLLLLALGLLLLGGGSGTAAVTPDQLALLQSYQPVVLFHADEDWAPQTVEAYLKQARIERQSPPGGWSTVQPPIPTSTVGCTSTPCFRLNLPCSLRSGYSCYRKTASATGWRTPVVYATVVTVPASAPPPPGQTQRPSLLLHYWLFYAFDDWHSLHNRLWQTHEGDWESITVGLNTDQQPMFAAYSEHCSGTVSPWSAVTRRGGTHPVAYVALGSHANWFTSSATQTRFAECLASGVGAAAKARLSTLIRVAQDNVVDRMGAAHASGPAGLPGVTPMQLVALDPKTTDWARFPGRWGEGQIVWLGATPRAVTTVSRGLAPATPNWSAGTIAATWHPATG
jgi:hypothetical protein